MRCVVCAALFVIALLLGAHFADPSQSSSSPAATSSPVPEIGQGDMDCSGGIGGEGGHIDALDALALLVYVADLPPVRQHEGCVEVGHEASNGRFGDIDCDGQINVADAVQLLRHIARLSVRQDQPCQLIGRWPAIGT